MKITSITILERRQGSDIVYLRTDLPMATYPYEGNQDLRFDVAKGVGRNYVRSHFPDIKAVEIIAGG